MLASLGLVVLRVKGVVVVKGKESSMKKSRQNLQTSALKPEEELVPLPLGRASLTMGQSC